MTEAPGMNVRVEIAREASQEVIAGCARLLPQLSSTAKPLDHEAVDRMLTHDANTVHLARTPAGIVGMLTLAVLPLPSGLRARVEDVVVDTAARGQGVAGPLIEEALRIAHETGARTVDLTSRPDRGPANRLYERLGFRARESTVYRFPLEGPTTGPTPS